jgi:hypothetical protein
LIHDKLRERHASKKHAVKPVTTALRQAEDKIETLRHEKLFLVQEKAQLMGP